MPDPRRTHYLDQFIALNLDVQARLREHKKALLAAGWSEPEAWAMCQRVEERILGPAMDLTATRLKLEEKMDAFLADEKERRAAERASRSESVSDSDPEAPPSS